MRFLASALIIGASLMVAPIANGQIIFDALAGDAVSTFSNAANPGPTFAVSGSTATLTRSNAALSHFVSNDTIQTLNGGVALTATDVVRVTWQVDSAVGHAAVIENRNAVEVGLATDLSFRGGTNLSTISRMRGDSNLVNANRVGHIFENVFSFDTTTSATDGPGGNQTENEETVEGGTNFGASSAGFEDGFTVVQTISAAGVTTQYTDIEVFDLSTGSIVGNAATLTDGTTLTTVIDPFDPAFDFVTFINGSRFYAGASIFNPTGGVITFSTAQIEINPDTSTPLLGDINMDGEVDFLDIAPFIMVLSAGDMFLAEADINEDDAVDFLDISPFIMILASNL